jgi:rhamnosyltransferase
MKTCAIIISYNPSENIRNSVNQLSQQVKKIIIVDNASSDNDSQKILTEIKLFRQTEIIFNAENLGIAAALNQGINVAISEKYDWIGTFDQDTIIKSGFISGLLSCYDGIESNQDIAIICPIYIDSVKGIVPQSVDKHYRFVKSTMTSGSLMKASAVRKIGFFDEELFIDWVDHDYCMKTRLAKYRIVTSIDTHLIHVPGNTEQHLLFGIKLCTSNHSSIRRYYMYRNRIICAKRYLVFDPVFILKDIWIGSKDLVKIIFLEKNKIAKLLMISEGIIDGLFNKTGAYQSKKYL